MQRLYYRGVSSYSFRSMQWGLVIGTIYKNRWCFMIEYEDGVLDYSPMIDTKNYELMEK